MNKLLLAALLISVSAWVPVSPFNGTWKVDLNKIQFPEKPETWVLQNDRYQCSTCVPKIDIKADGTDQPVPGTKYRDTLAVKIVNNDTVQMTSKKGMAVVGIETHAISTDRQTLTTDFKNYPDASTHPVTGKVMMRRVARGPAGAHAYSGSWRSDKIDTMSTNALTLSFQVTASNFIMTAATGETYEAKFDGKDYPVKGDRGGSVVSLTKISENSIDEIVKRDGKMVAVNHMTVSEDGKTMAVKSDDKERGTTTSYVMIRQ
jgi:hypothetical protein